MEPNNFDKDIKQKFNSREIEPSAQAWDRLDAMLTVAEEKKQPKRFSWLGIAATFLVFSGIGYVFFQQNQKLEISKPTNEVVIAKETPTNEVENNQDNEAIISPEVENELAIATPKSTNTTPEKASKQKNNTKYKSELDSHKAVTEKLNELIAKNENKTTPQEQTNTKTTPESLLAEVQSNNKTNGNTNTHKPTLKVNPNDLLKSVESELDQSFKSKALRQFNQAKSVVVNRNYN